MSMTRDPLRMERTRYALTRFYMQGGESMESGMFSRFPLETKVSMSATPERGSIGGMPPQCSE